MAIKRQGSGRTKGSFSFVKIPLEDLCSKFKDSKTPVIVSRKWAESVGFIGLVTSPSTTIKEQARSFVPEDVAKVNIVNLDEEV